MNQAAARRACMRVALGREAADMVIKGGTVVDVYSSTTVRSDLAIKAGRIAYVGDCDRMIGPETEVIDATGRYLVPGFIDGHTHIGAAQLCMTELAKVLVARGTVAMCVDFHIPGIVGGLPAIRHLIDELNRTPLRTFFTVGYQMYTQNGPIWNTGKVSDEDLLAALDWPETIGISEWLLWFYSDPEVHRPGMQALFDEVWRRGLMHVGHAHTYPRDDLQAYVALAASSDHEAVSVDEVADRVAAGMFVMLKENFAIKMTSRLMPGIIERGIPTQHLGWNTDGISGAFEKEVGHLDNCVREGIKAGLDPIAAIQMASLNPARYFRKEEELGSLAPGRLAHVVMVDDLRSFNVVAVVADGRLVARDGEYVEDLRPPDRPSWVMNTMNVGRTVTAADFHVPAPGFAHGQDAVRTRVIGLGNPITRSFAVEMDLPVVDGYVQHDLSQDVCRISVVERNLASGAVGNCFIVGTGIKRGAFGISTTGGAADIGIIGASEEDMAVVANRLVAMGGGACLVIDGEVVAEVPTPVLGLFSDEPAETVIGRAKAFNAALERLEATVSPMRALRFAALPRAVPAAKVSQRGLCEVGPMEARLLDMFVEPA
jgi:adenine deaminase